MLYFFSQDVTLRAIFAFITSFTLGIFCIPIFIKWAVKRELREKIKVESTVLKEQSKSKKDTPTMGGVAILFLYLFTVMLYGNLSNIFLLISLFVVTTFGLLGICDDLIKTYTSQKGLNTYNKLYFSSVISFVIVACLYKFPTTEFTMLPFISQNYIFPVSFFFLILGIATITGCSHGVNITDGMDGLAAGCCAIVILFYIVTIHLMTSPLYIEMFSVKTHFPIQEIIVCNAALLGACLSFLWYNTFPASIFMGDCGALMLGGYIGYVAVISRTELFLVIVGGVFVLETISSAMQIFAKKFLGRRIFVCAPIHHHFRAKGIDESKLVVQFWISQVILFVIAMFAY